MSPDVSNAKFVDLHIHTNFSDGSFYPEEAVEYASKIGLSAIAITDHDSVDGIESALEAGKKFDVEIIPGIELSAELQAASSSSEIHILGYYLNCKSDLLMEKLEELKKQRYLRALEILKKLKAVGVVLDDDFVVNSKSKALGRLHFAQKLLEEGFVSNVQEAFQKYLSQGRAAFVPKVSFPVKDAIKLILDSDGIPVVAHPYYIYNNDVEKIFDELSSNGLAGIEVWHTKHNAKSVKKFLRISQKLGLIATGGSDCHGKFNFEPIIMGSLRISYSTVDNLKKHKESM
jgi:predicted metal-dependent phosphoesterase TrpH